MASIMLHISFVILFLINVINAQIIVDTTLGKVAGVKYKSIIKDEVYYSFMGIPYAKPPVGKLKFMPPEPHDGWKDVLNTKKERKPCSQIYIPLKSIENYGYCGDDDCLHLSVHTRKLPKDEDINMPVIVFLYNEHFRVSFNASKDYGPDFIVKEDVILVTINHRLGSAGFLAFDDEILPGNNGLRDVILALKWLKENIHNFGGDPKKITLMGVNGGAALVDILVNSPKTKGLISGAIMHSGTAWNSLFMTKNPIQHAKNLAKSLERTAITSMNLISELREVSPMDLGHHDIASTDADESRRTQMGSTNFGPVVEPNHPDAIVTKYPEDGPIDIDIPIMIGYNSREGLEICERILRKPDFLTFADRDFLMVLPIRAGFSFDYKSNIYRHAVDEIKEFYFDEGYIKVSNPGEYITYIGDVMVDYPIDYAVGKYANESKSPVYYYTFDYSGDLNMRKSVALENALTIEGTWGATGGDELCYLFVCKPIKRKYDKVLKDENSEELKVINDMIRLWTNFAKHGNPTPEGSDFIWKPATKENKDILVVSEDLEMKTNLHRDRYKFLDDFIAKYKELAVDGIVKDEKDEL